LAPAAVFLLAALSTLGARADPADTTARALIAAWKDADPGMAKVAEVIAGAFASGMAWGGTIEGRPIYCPPSNAPLKGGQIMGGLERFVADNPESADKTYGFALSASLAQTFPCAPDSKSR
jgi:hypothetical protein